MSLDVEKEIYYLEDRRDKALEELHKEYYAATNNTGLLVKPTNFPWLDDFIRRRMASY